MFANSYEPGYGLPPHCPAEADDRVLLTALGLKPAGHQLPVGAANNFMRLLAGVPFGVDRIKMGGSFSGGDAVVESVCVLPGTLEDSVYYIVKRLDMQFADRAG
jgi:hypothetical protein